MVDEAIQALGPRPGQCPKAGTKAQGISGALPYRPTSHYRPHNHFRARLLGLGPPLFQR